ncbi:MAG: OPT family oligopeptide transporter [Sandaracinaceae bacterium]|nr:OPT family oligopeptide transporter [Sandaracinaceae bacterium]
MPVLEAAFSRADGLGLSAVSPNDVRTSQEAPQAAPCEAELTLRAVLTGALLGGVLSLCNIYSGLRIGWGFNMSITAALLGWGIWSLAKAGGGRPFTKLENNLNQTAASAGASISSAGLVSAIPAWTLMTGDELSWPALALWTGTIGLLGVVVGIGLRRQMIEVDRLPFASGIASAETLDKIHGSGAEGAKIKLYALVGAGCVSAAIKLLAHLLKLKPFGIPGTIGIGKGARATLMNLTIGIDPSPLMVAVGALGTLRTGITLLLGSLVSWGVIAPKIIELGWCERGPAQPDEAWFAPVVKWMLWPGVAMMVTSSLTSVAFSWRSFVRAFRGGRIENDHPSATQEELPKVKGPDVAPSEQRLLLIGITILCAVTQWYLFAIPLWMGVFSTVVTFVLATVAARVSGETTVTPVGAMGKVTQLLFGLIRPGDATTNLMTANVTGGAASQTADLLHDLKAGLLLGASPRAQAIAQSAGVLGGALIGSAGYLILIPEPKRMLLTEDWPAPAVVTWRAVAELFAKGIEAMPQGAIEAMVVGGALGVILSVLEKTLPGRYRLFVPSPASLGLAFVIQAWTCLSLFVGSLIGWALRRWAPRWSEAMLTPIASGVVAGESLMGVGIAVHSIFSS